MMCSTESKASVDMRRVVHRQHDAGDDLDDQHDREDAAEGPPVVQVARRRNTSRGSGMRASIQRPRPDFGV
jgi:hypothetical protein